MGRAVGAPTPQGAAPTLHALHISSREDQPDEHGLERLVRQVLRSTLEQLLTRQAGEVGENEGASQHPKRLQSMAAAPGRNVDRR